MMKEHANQVSCVAMVSGSNYAVSGSLEKTIRLWNIETGKSPGVVEGHTEAVSDLVWSGNWICMNSRVVHHRRAVAMIGFETQ
jgi:WD40 repeat protein